MSLHTSQWAPGAGVLGDDPAESWTPPPAKRSWTNTIKTRAPHGDHPTRTDGAAPLDRLRAANGQVGLGPAKTAYPRGRQLSGP